MARLHPEAIPTSLDVQAYKKFLPSVTHAVVREAKKVKSRTIIHVSATARGGGVAELLQSQIPLERSLGLDSHWLTIKEVPIAFFVITKKIHNFFQGKQGALTEKELELYREINHDLGESLKEFCSQFPEGGIVVIHDPQPAPIVSHIPDTFSAILRLHIDLLTPNPTIVEALRPAIEAYPCVVVSSKEYKAALPWVAPKRLKVIPPAIDPFTEKNNHMSLTVARSVLTEFTINCTKPIVTQVSRFDPWKDPLGVIRAYYIAKNDVPDLQLVLAGFFIASDDPEAVEVFEQVERHAEGDPDIYVFANTRDLGTISNDTFISALYTASTVIMQKSIREGFGLTMTEAMWKGKPVIAGHTTGGATQIQNNKNGILVSSPEEAAHALVRLLEDKELRERLGIAAHESVKEKFLFVRFLLDNIMVYASLCGKDSSKKKR